MSSFSVFDSKGGEFVGPNASPIIIIYKRQWSEKGRIVDYGVRGRIKSIMPHGDIYKGKISFQRCLHVVCFNFMSTKDARQSSEGYPMKVD